MRLLMLCSSMLLVGCAQIAVTQVGANGVKTPGDEPGFYVPRLMPYLIVADLPIEKTVTVTPVHQATPHKVVVGTNKVAGAANNDGDSSKETENTTGATTSSSSAVGSASDLSFVATTKQYIIKLVYLPDYTHQQAIHASSGWFGKASFQMALADGALTSLSANTDNTENGEVVKAAMTAAITAATGGASGVAGAAKSSASSLTGRLSLALANLDSGSATPSDSFLHPGLYQIFDKTTGDIAFKKIILFSSNL